MRINTQFPVALHILAVIFIKKGDPSFTSERIARSVSTNPVVIRRILSQLKKAGLTQTKPCGTGFALSKPPETITLCDVYRAVRTECSVLFDMHENPNQRCIVGACILDVLEKPFASAQRAMEAELARFTMKDVIDNIIQQDIRKGGGMKKIFEPARLGGLELKNRLIRSATYEIGCIENTAFLPALQTIYTDLAHGGIGLIITGMMGVSPMSSLGTAAIYGDTFVAETRGLADAVHKAGSKIVIQLGHQGAKASPLPEGTSPESPSDVELPGCTPAKAMSKKQISSVIKDYGKAALRCKEAGADGVQIHGAHGYLISQFLSPYFNKRTDEYGGSIQNRARLLFEVFDEVRGTVGAFPILVKFNYSDLVEPGISPQESVWVCEQLAKHGVDAIEISSGVGFDSKTSPSQRRFIEEGFFAQSAADIASRVSVPIIAMGGFRTPQKIEEWLNKGNFEAISLSRPLIREPMLAKRWSQGDTAKATCVSCSKCFLMKKHGCYLDKRDT